MVNAASGLAGRSLSRPIRIVAADGFPLGATVFEPLRRARGTVVVNGAMAVPASYYGRFADHLAAADLRVVTYDYRGVGASRPERLPGFSATLTDWAMLDATAVLGWVQREHDPETVVLVGHSFGGQLLGLVDRARDVRGAVLVGAQLGYYGHWPLPMRLRLAFAWHALLPALTASLGYLPGRAGLGEDVPAGVAEEWASWCRHPDYLIGFHPAARARFARFDRPTLFYSFSDDDYAPLRSVHKLIGAMPHSPMFHRRFHPAELGVDEVGHFGFFRPRFADSLWREARFFIDDALAGRDQFRLPKLRTPYDLSEEDLAADLAYGRS